MTLEPSKPLESPDAEEPQETKCPHCGSSNWDCWDERVETHYNKETNQEYDFPVGYMNCKDCKKTWIDDPFADENIQDEIDEMNRYL